MLLFLFAVFVVASSENEILWKTRSDVFAHYNKSVSPFEFDENNPLRVEIGVIIGRIHDFDLKRSVLTMLSMISLEWYDDRLNWTNANDTRLNHGVSLSRSSVWLAPYQIFNNAMPEEPFNESTVSLSRGRISTFNQLTSHTVCVPTTKWFPFDIHKCNLIVGTPFITTENGQLDIEQNDYFLEWAFNNSKWEVIEHFVEKSVYNPVPNSVVVYQTSNYTLMLARTDGTIALTILCPVLLSALLGILPYCLSPDEGIAFRIGISISALIVSIKTINQISSMLPMFDENTPIIVQFCLASTFVICFSICQTIILSFFSRFQNEPSSKIQLWSKSKPANFLLKLWGIDFRRKPSNVELLLENTGNHENLINNVTWKEVSLLADSLALILNLLTLTFLFLFVAITE